MNKYRTFKILELDYKHLVYKHPESLPFPSSTGVITVAWAILFRWYIGGSSRLCRWTRIDHHLHNRSKYPARPTRHNPGSAIREQLESSICPSSAKVGSSGFFVRLTKLPMPALHTIEAACWWPTMPEHFMREIKERKKKRKSKLPQSVTKSRSCSLDKYRLKQKGKKKVPSWILIYDFFRLSR